MKQHCYIIRGIETRLWQKFKALAFTKGYPSIRKYLLALIEVEVMESEK